jgi:TetR/AcrR family transcriptional regulator
MAAKPGERKLQILQTVAAMLEQPKGEKITTAALAAKLDLSEAALYRHFASKAQMFEGLIEFIEQTVFGLANKITADESSGLDALVNEDERLQQRINQVLDRIEATLKQALRIAVTQNELAAETDVGAQANALLCFVIGRWQLFAKSGYARDPLAQWPQQWAILSGR